jgi:hypothetical protein
MKTTIDRHDFAHAFQRAARADNFSSQGLRLLFAYFEELEEQTGEEIELDVIAICCEYTEDTVAEIARNYSIDLNDADPESDDYDEQCRQIVFDYLSDRTSVVGDTADGFVYLSF